MVALFSKAGAKIRGLF